jgi:ElaB/YqjD/DUF883 family membrane-anchored ribosome-binding protein
MVSNSRRRVHRDNIQRDFDAIKDDLRRLRSDGGVLVRDAFTAGRGTAADATAALQDRVKAAAGKGKETFTQGLTLVGGHVGRRPGTALAAAFGVGLIFGLILMRGRHDERAYA